MIIALVQLETWKDSGHAQLDDYLVKESRVVEVENFTDLNELFPGSRITDIRVLERNDLKKAPAEKGVLNEPKELDYFLFQAKEIKDTLRLTGNIYKARTKETAYSRGFVRSEQYIEEMIQKIKDLIKSK